MSLLGCNAKLLWNEIYTQIIDVIVSSSSHNQVGIIVCTQFHKINSELLDNFYSYMQGINSTRLKYILISEHVGFIPDNIMHNCKIIHVPKPTASNYNKCASIAAVALAAYDKNIILPVKTTTADTKDHFPHESLCNAILVHLKDPDSLKFLSFRDVLYDILIYNYDIGECMWYILNNLVNCGLLQVENLSDILIDTYTSLQYFNNNYRPIYHLENYMYNIISRIHGYGVIKK
jgi:hypothetical protein